MRPSALRLWVLGLVALLVAELSQGLAAQHEVASSPVALAAEEKEACARNLKVIYDAIQAYQFDHKDLPNWLSDLVPDYLADGNVLICPVCRRTGKTEARPLADPRLACSYVFEFCPVPTGVVSPGETPHTRREWKRRQMGLIGSAVPMVRCRNHNPVLNLGFNGSIYESPDQWELLFTNRVRAAELSLRSIFGGEDPEERPAPTPLTSAKVEESPRKQPAAQHPIDLAGFYTTTLADSWLGKPGDNLASLPAGLQNLGGIEFNVRGLIQLKGKSGHLSKFPGEVKGIPVRQRCQHLYFLHAASVSGHTAEGEEIGSYVIHLPNNPTTLDIPIYYGRSVRSWHEEQNEPQPVTELKVGWTGDNAVSKEAGKRIRLFVTAWNLAPGVEIDTIDFVSAGKTAAPFLLALSFD